MWFKRGAVPSFNGCEAVCFKKMVEILYAADPMKRAKIETFLGESASVDVGIFA